MAILADEAFFLHTIIDMIYAELKGCAELNGARYNGLKRAVAKFDNGELVLHCAPTGCCRPKITDW